MRPSAPWAKRPSQPILDGEPSIDRPRIRPTALSDRNVFLLLAAITLTALLTALLATRGINPLRGDSAEYLYFDRSRTVGYPAFLALVRLSTGHVALAVQAQMALLAGSLLFLGWSFHELGRRPAWSLAFQAFLVIQAGMWFASAFLMTEALSAALVALWCAQLLRLSKSPAPSAVTFLVVISALATTVRPSFVALFFGTAVFIVAAPPPREGFRALLIAGAGLAATWVATPVAQYLVHGSPRTTSPLARGVLQHTLYCAPHAVPNDPDSRLVEREAAPVRHYIENAPNDVQEQLRRSYSTPLRFGSIIPLLGRRHRLSLRSNVDSYLARIAGERMRSNPSCYASSVLSEYVRMAVFATDPTSEDGRQANAFMAANPPVEVPQYPVLPGDAQLARSAAAEVGNEVAGLNPARQRLDVVAQVPFVAMLPLRLLFGAAALIGLCSLLALPLRRRLAPEYRPTIEMTAAMGAAYHGTLAITAIVEIGFFRYLVPLWPVVCTLVALPLLHLIEARSRQRATKGVERDEAAPAPALPVSQ